MTTPSHGLGLFTDFYELSMGSSLTAHGLDAMATFELFVRRLPPTRRYLVACGIQDALDGLGRFRLDADEGDYLSTFAALDRAFVERLCDTGFTGSVSAVAEGEVVFAGEPIMQVTAPLVEAQIVETFLLNTVGFATLVASKASRIATACGSRRFIEFGARRAHGVDAAMAAARAAYIGGAVGTSLTAAARRFAIPVSGTMAHSFVMSFEHEIDAFRAFAASYPNGDAVLLVDTYDTIEGTRRAVALADQGVRFRGVRLDSGDLGVLAKTVRSVLDDAGLTDVTILASGDLDEFTIRDLLADGAPIDAFGVGTQLSTSADAPSLSCVYKLVEDEHGPKMKHADGKVTFPGRKQVYRFERDGSSTHDVITLTSERRPSGARALLRPVMERGALLPQVIEPIEVIRARCAAATAALPGATKALEPTDYPAYRVECSPALLSLMHEHSRRAH
ncbi:MAG: nicotinate phosphoribosyltransferase [Acidimicrobiia bacterium]